MLHIVVCVKVVIDPEAPSSTFQIDAENQRVVPGPGVPPVLNPYDENALEAALRLKEHTGAGITVVSLGATVPRAVIRKCFAVGADDIVIIEDELFRDASPFITALALADVIRRLPPHDLILTGRLAADTNAGIVGAGIAERLGLPLVSAARHIEVNDDTARIQRVRSDGRDVVEIALPCVITVSHESGELRQATVKGLIEAKKHDITVWNAADLGLGLSSEPVSLNRLYVPENRVICEFAAGETTEELATGLVTFLKGNKYL